MRQVIMQIHALGQWCIWQILNIQWRDFVRNDDIRPMTEPPPLTSIVKRRCISLYGHIAARMDGAANANRILFEPLLELWRRPPGDRTPPGSNTSTITWPRLTWSCLRQEMQLRIDLSGKCWLRIALRTHSGACYANIGLEEIVQWQRHQMDHSQIICTSMQTDNHTSTLSFNYYYYYYKICIAHKFKHARVGGAGVAGWGSGLAGEGKTPDALPYAQPMVVKHWFVGSLTLDSRIKDVDIAQ